MKKIGILLLSLLSVCTLRAQVPTIAADLLTGSNSSNPYAFTTTSGKLYFQAMGTSIFEYGTSGASPTAPGNYTNAYNRGPMSYFNGKLYFTGFLSSVIANRVFAFNVTTGGNAANICDSIDVSFNMMVEQGGKLYFFGKSSNTSRYGMFYVDASGAVHLAAYVPTSMVITYTNEMVVMNNIIYFSANIVGTEWVLFSFNPSTNTFATINNPASSSSNIRCLIAGDDNKLYYSDATSSGGRQIFSYSGSGNPTQLTTLNSSGIGINNPYDYASVPGYGQNMIKWGNKLYFSGCDGIHGFELMSYDLTTNTPSLIKDINLNSASSNPGSFALFAGKLYFSADNGTNGRELWATDGTASGTTMIADTNPGASGSAPWFMTVHSDGSMYFSATDGTSGNELFKMTSPSGISQVSYVSKLNVFPNPAPNQCTLSVELFESQAINVEVTNQLGQTVITTNSQKHINHNVTFNLSALATGTYHYRVVGEKGNTLAVGSILH